MTVETQTRPAASEGQTVLALVGVLAIGVVVLFWDALGNLWSRWGEQEELSHSYFIPLISGWLVWSNRTRVMASVGAPSFIGAPFLVVAALLYLLGGLTESFLFQQVGLVATIAGLVGTFGGRSLLRSTAAPIAFLLFAVPPPYMLITILSWKFQLISSQLGVAMIKAMGVPVFLSGNVIDLGDYQLQVAEACSGLRYLFPFLSLGVMTAYIFRGPLWQKALIVASTIPITIIMNSLRIALTGALVQAFGTAHAEGALHLFEGWVVFLLCLAALFGLVALLGALRKPRVSALDALGSPELPAVPPAAGAGSPVAAFAVAGAILAAAFIGGRALTVDSFIVPDRKPFILMPEEFPGWKSNVQKINPTVADVLGADDSIVVDMISPDGEYFNLYLAYLEARRDGRSWHSPRQCIPGGGWEITRHDVDVITRASGAPLNFNRLVIENRGRRQLVYYWYDQRGRTIANEFMMRIWLTVDAVTRKRSDGAMIRLMTAIRDGETLDDAEARLTGMIDRMDTFLPDYVPH